MPGVSAVLLAHSPEPEKTVAAAARLCYSPSGVAALLEALSDAEVSALLEKLISLGHLSALEHASFTFGLEGISRSLSHQLVRHRLASYSQQSQRYVTLGTVNAIVPPTVAAHPAHSARFEEKLKELWALYGEMVGDGIPAEDARYILPNACETKIVVTMNARELRHFFSLRLCNRAQWEIRLLAVEMLKLCAAAAPRLFKGCGPGCVEGPCPEGAMTCGRAVEVRKSLSLLRPA